VAANSTTDCIALTGSLGECWRRELSTYLIRPDCAVSNRLSCRVESGLVRKQHSRELACHEIALREWFNFRLRLIGEGGIAELPSLLTD
jgi:hypothetical protein